MRRKLQRAAAATATIAIAAGAATAGATTGKRSDFDLGFSTATPGAVAGLSFHVVYKAAGDPDAKPSPIRKVVVSAPAGTRFDTAGKPQCSATDEQLRAEGSGACPASSRIGAGKLVAITGFGPPVDPVMGDLTLFNGPDQVVEVVTVPGTDRVLGLDRLSIKGSTLTGNPPTTPGGPPDGETAVRQIDFTIEKATGYVRTPAACPSSRRWTSTGTFGFADGAEETLTSSTPCKRALARRPRLSISPARARVGRPTRFVARVSGASAACTSGVRVRIGGRRGTTGPGGRVRLTVTVRQAGAHLAAARKPGCPTLAAGFRGVR
jgi:hypothetical protein